MRDDMSKVLVESPRGGQSRAASLEGSRRRARARADRDDVPLVGSHLGMRRDGHHKHFGEHLGPLYRWLRAQVNRPWSKVYGELCANLDRRSVVQNHLFEHIEDRVDVATVWRDDQVWVRGRRGLEPLGHSWAPLYVHPRTGILLPNRARDIERRRERESSERAKADPDRRIVPGEENVIRLRVEGLWFEVQLGALDLRDEKTRVWDAVLRRQIGGTGARGLGGALRNLDGRSDRYAITKRQLSSRELRRNGLESIAE